MSAWIQVFRRRPARDKTPLVQRTAWHLGGAGYRWLVLLVAWLGWVFDAMDATIYALVLHPALQDLLPRSGVAATGDAIGWYGGVIFSVFLIGWALGGVLFGVLADRMGRTRVLIFTILLYAAFTGLAALSQTWWQLGVFRFLTALGIGGEWAAGAALVAEVWPEPQRARAAGGLQSAWAVGFFAAALIALLLRNHGWRPVFVVGVAPALVAWLVRLWVKEPERWLKARQEEPFRMATELKPAQCCPNDGTRPSSRREAEGGPASRRTPAFPARGRRRPQSKLAELFSPALRRPTIVGSGLAFVAVFGLWGATNWTPTLLRALPELQSLPAAAVNSRISYATMLLNVGALLGYLSFGPLADRLGRRVVFGLMCLGSLVMLPVTFLAPRSYLHVLLLLPLLGFFNNGIFSGFPIYLPELYPTRLRATGAGFCFNVGRVLASAGPFLTGWLVTALGGFGRAASAVALIYLAGLCLLPFAPETKGKPLPE
jgi:MFS family permease